MKIHETYMLGKVNEYSMTSHGSVQTSGQKIAEGRSTLSPLRDEIFVKDLNF